MAWHPRRRLTREGRVAAVETEVTQRTTSGDGPTVDDLLAEHPELADDVFTLLRWGGDGEPTMPVSAAARRIHQTLHPPPWTPAAGAPYDRDSSKSGRAHLDLIRSQTEETT